MNSTLRAPVALLALACLAAAAVACASLLRAGAPSGDQASVNASATFPPGAEGELIRYGRDLIAQTPQHAGQYVVTVRMSCQACHPSAGTIPHAGSLLGTYAKFPQWSKRAHRFIALQDRLAECFLYSMNGKPPAYYSREMIAMTAYISWLSRGAPTGTGFPNQGPVTMQAVNPPSATNGARIYAARCATCHGADGNGKGWTYPPLWGPASFNDKAGMGHIERLAPFVRAAMPSDAPGTLTDQEATDVAAFILAHPRPHFNKAKLVEFRSEKAGYF